MNKKKITIALLGLLAFVFVFSDGNAQNRRERKKLYNSAYNYEVVCVGTGVEGVKLLKVFSYEKKVDQAKIECKKDAIAACIFKGASGYDEVPPIVTQKGADIVHQGYFDKFFETGGQYLNFVSISTDAQPNDIIKMKKMYKVGVVVAVRYDALRQKLEEDGIIESMSEAADAGKMPTIMIFPSDVYCNKNGYMMEFDDQGRTVRMPDYKLAMQSDENLRLVIAEIQQIYAKRGYPVKDLEQELKSIEAESAEMAMLQSKESGSAVAESPIDILKRTAKADIILDLDFSIKTDGPKKYIVFNLRGLDAYTSKAVASASGSGKPSFSAQPELLLEEAVLGHLDIFNSQIMKHFEDIKKNGREIKVLVKMWDSAPVDLEEVYDLDGDDLELLEVIDEWMEDNTVNGRFSNADNSATFIRYEQVRIPLTYERRGKTRTMDARKFASNLRSMLKDEPFYLDAKIYQRGLGEAWIIIGEK